MTLVNATYVLVTFVPPLKELKVAKMSSLEFQKPSLAGDTFPMIFVQVACVLWFLYLKRITLRGGIPKNIKISEKYSRRGRG